MKHIKKINYILSTLSLLAIVSCTKQFDTSSIDEKHSVEFSIIADAPSYEAASTKGSVGSGARVYWQEGANADKVSVLKLSTSDASMIYMGDLQAPKEEEKEVATTTFSNTISGLTIGDKLAIVYPAITGKNIGDDVSNFEETCFGNYQTANPKRGVFCAYATIEYNGSSLISSTKFNMASSFLLLSLAAIPDDIVSLQTITISNINSSIIWKNNNGTFEFSAPSTENVCNVNVTFSNPINVSSTHTAQVGVGIPASASTANRQIVLNKVKQIAYTNAKINNNTYYSAIRYNGYESLVASGEFSVGGEKIVKFSLGNLYYNGSEFKFEANQYDYRTYAGDESCIDGSITVNGTPSNHCGLFRWANNSGNLSADISSAISTGFPLSSSTADVLFTNATQITPRTDFHVNGETGENKWRILSKSEWEYLIITRKVTVGSESKASYGEGAVMNVNGLIILPDNWDGSVCSGFVYGLSAWSNTFNESSTPTWSQMEAAGCVFLPASGARDGSKVYGVGRDGYYCSSTEDKYSPSSDYVFNFCNESISTEMYPRGSGQSFRMVRE